MKTTTNHNKRAVPNIALQRQWWQNSSSNSSSTIYSDDEDKNSSSNSSSITFTLVHACYSYMLTNTWQYLLENEHQIQTNIHPIPALCD